MNKNYLEYLAKLDLTTYHYKILLLLNTRPYNQAELARELGSKNQNIFKHIRTLELMNLIEVDRVEGRNKFYRAVTDLKKLQKIIPGQIKM